MINEALPDMDEDTYRQAVGGSTAPEPPPPGEQHPGDR